MNEDCSACGCPRFDGHVHHCITSLKRERDAYKTSLDEVDKEHAETVLQNDVYRLALEDIVKFAVKDGNPARCEAVAKGALTVKPKAEQPRTEGHRPHCQCSLCWSKALDAVPDKRKSAPVKVCERCGGERPCRHGD